MNGDETLDAYLNCTQEYADALTAIDEPVKDKDFVMLVVSGLREELSSITPSSPQAFYGAHPSNKNRSNNNNNRGNHNNSCGNKNNQGRGNGRQFDWASTQNTVYGTCNRCGVGHIPSQCPNRDPSTIRTRPSTTFANTRAQFSNASVNWHSDTRANGHVTPGLEAMDNSEAYYDDDALYVGNDKGIPILHIGSSKSSNGQPSPVSTTSIPTPPPPPPPITRQHPLNHHQNPKQQVPYNPSSNHGTVLPTSITEPTSFTFANNSPEWRQAMKEELKRDKNGVITRYKARFVTICFQQQPDVRNAFLHGNLKEQVYVKQPSGFIDPQPLNYFLGIQIVPHVSNILLSQKKYILELLQRDGLCNYNLVSSPMVTSSLLSLDDSTAFSNLVKYRQVVGSLQYVTLSWPDIAFAINKSMGGFAIYLGSNLISWIARKQRTVSCSFTEAEYKTLTDTVVELTWLQALLHELGIGSSSTPILWCDNLGATYLSANPIFHACIKNVEIDYHFVREKVA
ncbi:nucleotide-binding alpha-beta plait domain-containing protein [Tanacetum coccineum]